MTWERPSVSHHDTSIAVIWGCILLKMPAISLLAGTLAQGTVFDAAELKMTESGRLLVRFAGGGGCTPGWVSLTAEGGGADRPQRVHLSRVATAVTGRRSGDGPERYVVAGDGEGACLPDAVPDEHGAPQPLRLQQQPVRHCTLRERCTLW